MNNANVILLLKHDEGFKSKPYKDSQGILTIGYGHNLACHGLNEKDTDGLIWTEAVASAQLNADMTIVTTFLSKDFPAWGVLDDVRQAVVISMGFIFGEVGLSKWKPTLSLIFAGKYNEAASHLLGSLWQKELKEAESDKNTPTRVERFATMLIDGEWPSFIQTK